MLEARLTNATTIAGTTGLVRHDGIPALVILMKTTGEPICMITAEATGLPAIDDRTSIDLAATAAVLMTNTGPKDARTEIDPESDRDDMTDPAAQIGDDQVDTTSTTHETCR